ncbi:hypothetical protein PV10_00280 [Exophiala mesophila]|uniref:Signal recognition particle subunit SRP14 n=1 Tax=Exophiala mesophila TaxID=212818 RepID=A0A0D2ABW3_EXOME|nr:uncharacterized protein PV10_00280 [Exophiala mesophila]KIV96408.1 hypothetical protein PV10_00280 [Exophiala mesophila]
MSRQERLSNDEFLTRLTTLFTSTHSSGHGSIYLTQKPLVSTEDSTSSSSPPQVLIRATDGLSKSHRVAKSGNNKSKSQSAGSIRPKVRLATVVEAEDVDSFYVKYAESCKKGMEALRKRDKKKAKEKAKAKKKGKSSTAPVKAAS